MGNERGGAARADWQRDRSKFARRAPRLLVVYRLVYPKAEADEVIAFIAQHSRFPRLYSRSDISIAEKAVGLTRKRGSTTADSRRVRCCVAISSGCRPTRSASWERRGSA